MHQLTRSLPGRLLAAMFALALLAAACGNGDDGDDTTQATPSPDATPGEPEPVPGFDGTTIRVGVVTPLSGPAAIIGLPLTAGNRVWFEHVNAQGGIAGRYRIEMVEADNQYIADETITQYNRIKSDVVMFAQILGTPPTQAVLPLLRQDNIVASPASLDADWVREQNLLPIGGPYQIQMINGADYYLRTEGSTDSVICAMIQDDPYGAAGLEGLEFAAGELGFEITTVARYTAGDQDFTGQLSQLRDNNCEAVFLVAIPSDSVRIWGAAATLGYAPRWLGQSPTWLTAFAGGDLAPYLEENLWIIAEGAEWGDESVPGMAEMIEHQEQYAPDQEPDIYFVFGYAQARAVTAVLERAVELGDLSREGIIAAMNDLDRLEFEGLSGDYPWGPPEERDPPRESSIFGVNADRPAGLEGLEINFASDAARAFEFD